MIRHPVYRNSDGSFLIKGKINTDVFIIEADTRDQVYAAYEDKRDELLRKFHAEDEHIYSNGASSLDVKSCDECHTNHMFDDLIELEGSAYDDYNYFCEGCYSKVYESEQRANHLIEWQEGGFR